jgi:hypothetical protein
MAALLDWLGEHVAEVIAICALAFTAYQAFLQRQQSRISVRPLVTTFVNRRRRDKVGELEVLLMNNGLGPALVKRFQVYVNGAECEADAAVTNLLGEMRVFHKEVTTFADDYAMPASTGKTLLAIKFPCATDDDMQNMVDRLNVIDLELVYWSAYRERFTYDSRVQPGAKLAARPAAPAARPAPTQTEPTNGAIPR